MRARKSLQVVLELSAIMGVVVVLSGSALAADGVPAVAPQGQPSNYQEPVPAFRPPLAPPPEQVPDPSLGPPQVQPGPAGTEQVPAGYGWPQGGVGGAAPHGGVQDGAPGHQVPVPSAPINSYRPTPSAVVSQTAAPASDVKGPSEVKPGLIKDHDKPSLNTTKGETGHDSEPKQAPKLPITASGDISTAPQVVTITTPAPDAHPGGGSAFRTQTLTIKPTITNRIAAMIPDLAATIPSAPAPTKNPEPTQSSGALGSLTAQLAGTVIPQPLTLVSYTADHFVPFVNLTVLVIMLSNVFVFTYGLWLRRGGFTTAPRSDSPELEVSPVATPLLLGYASLPLRMHNPIFSSVRNQTFVDVLLTKKGVR